jgi:muramidase (phage lysozyme)
MNHNRTAFLAMLAHSEGTTTVAGSDNGYNVTVGGHLFQSYKDHPRQRVYCPKFKVWSTAAGRYQLLARYFDAYKKLLALPDFSPASQDAIALQQIKERGALDDIDAGRFDSAVEKVSHLWASLPGSGYGQHENDIDTLRQFYTVYLSELSG